MKPLTEKQKKVYDYIVESSLDGRVPSVREICNACSLKSTSTAHLYLKALDKKRHLGLEEPNIK